MAITGTHLLMYTPKPEEARAALSDAFGFKHVDDGDGWLIFRLPPAEMGVHPSGGDTGHQITFMCDDIESTRVELAGKGVEISGDVVEHEWGKSVTAVLPGGLEVMVYQPSHAMAVDQ